MKRTLAFTLCLLILLTLSPVVLAVEIVGTYDDVDSEAWYAAAVEDVTAKGLMNGTGGGKFTPDGTLTRAMLVTVLWRMSGCPEAAAPCPFTDVEAGSWYASAVAWAAEVGAVNGIGSGLFAPEADVTREQMATIFYRWANSMGMDTATGETEIAMRENASEWAVDAVNWAISKNLLVPVLITGLPHGGSGYFYNMPAAAHRGEIADFVSRFTTAYTG